MEEFKSLVEEVVANKTVTQSQSGQLTHGTKDRPGAEFAVQAGIIPILVETLAAHGGGGCIALNLLNVSQWESCRPAVIAADALTACSSALRGSTNDSDMFCTLIVVLLNYAGDDGNAVANELLSQYKITHHLINMMGIIVSGEPRSYLNIRWNADFPFHATRELSVNEHWKAVLAKEGAIPLLIRGLKHPHPLTVRHSILTLLNMANSETLRSMLAEHGVFKAVLALAQSDDFRLSQAAKGLLRISQETAPHSVGGTCSMADDPPHSAAAYPSLDVAPDCEVQVLPHNAIYLKGCLRIEDQLQLLRECEALSHTPWNEDLYKDPTVLAARAQRAPHACLYHNWYAHKPSQGQKHESASALMNMAFRAFQSDKMQAAVSAIPEEVGEFVPNSMYSIVYPPSGRFGTHVDGAFGWVLTFSIGNDALFHYSPSLNEPRTEILVRSGDAVFFKGGNLYHGIDHIDLGTAPPFFEDFELTKGTARLNIQFRDSLHDPNAGRYVPMFIHYNRVEWGPQPQECLECGGACPQMVTCEDCKFATYCSSICRKNHRPTHQSLCRELLTKLSSGKLRWNDFSHQPAVCGGCSGCFICRGKARNLDK